MRSPVKKIIFLLAMTAITLCADDKKAEKLYAEGFADYQKKEYHDAARKFEAAEIEATDSVIKANSVRAKIAAFQMCGLYYQEFLAIESLLKDYPEFADFHQLADREFAIGELCYQGYREPMYWSLRWIPWLTDIDRTNEVMAAALQRSPFSSLASRALLRQAQLLDRDGKVKESLVPLRMLVKNHPQAKEYRIGMLGLANALCILATYGDGDSRYNTEATEVLNRYLEKFPKTEEEAWVRRQLVKLRDIQAQRLLKIAEFYEKDRRSEAAKRYLTEVVQLYPESLSAEDAERMLVKMDQNFLPDTYRNGESRRYPHLTTYKLPMEAQKVLITPYQSDNKYIQPVYELKKTSSESVKK